MALVEAAQSFDPSRNVKFTTYARYRIRGALRTCSAGWWSRAGGVTWRNAAIVPALPDTEELGHILGSEATPPVGEELEAVDAVEHWIRKLPAKHAQACRHMYLDGKNQEEAAAPPRLLEVAAVLSPPAGPRDCSTTSSRGRPATRGDRQLKPGVPPTAST